MIRKIFVCSLVAFWTLVAQAQPLTRQLRLAGTVNGPHQGKVYLQKYIDRYYELVDSATIGTDGCFTFSSQVVLPEIYGLSTSLDDTPFLLFLDEGDISVSLNAGRSYAGSTVSGSATHDLYTEYHRERGRDLTAFIREHPTSLVPLYILYREQVSRLSSDDIRRNLELFAPALQQTTYANILRSVLLSRDKIDIGQQAPLFSAPDANDNTVSLSDFLGKSYLLIDFWASWCGPCRKENPNVVKAYADYHPKGFDILAVSLDKARAPWLKAISDDHLDYHHVSELKFWDSDIARLYGIRSIPANVLVDPQGKIIGKNLRGDDLEKILRQLYTNN